MQMRRMYQSTNPRIRAAALRRDASELGQRGYPVFASVCAEEAEWISPSPRELDRDRRQERWADRNAGEA